MKKLLFALLLLALPSLAAAQSVDVEGDVASRVDAEKSTVVAVPTSVLANGSAVSIVTVTLRDENSDTLPNIEVTLTSSRGATDTIGHYEGTTLTPGNSYESDSNGVVRFGVRSSTVGTATVTAVAESLVTLDDKPEITFTAQGTGGGSRSVDPDASTLTADPTTLPADGVTLTTITVQVILSSGDSAPAGMIVGLTSSRGSNDFIGYFEDGELVEGFETQTAEKGLAVFASHSETAGNATYTAIAASTTLTEKPVVTFTPVGGGGGPGPEPQPQPEEETVIDKVIDFIKEQARNDTTNRTLAGLGAITTIALLPSLTTSIITALLQNIPLFNFLLTSWLPIRKRRYWGTVRDRKTGVPVAGVEVLLWQQGKTEPVAKYRTDQTGQYGFLVEKIGLYYLTIVNPLYLGWKSQLIEISRPAQIIPLDIALRANETEQVRQAGKARHYLDWVRYLNYFSVIMVSVGTIVAIYAYLAEPNLIAGMVLGLYAAIWTLKLYHYIRYRYYGAVVAMPDEKPLPSAIIQLTGQRQGIQALVHSTISDSKGRFLFIVKPAKYSMIVAKEGYEPAEAEVDEKRLAQTIRLQPSANDEMLNRPAPQPTI